MQWKRIAEKGAALVLVGVGLFLAVDGTRMLRLGMASESWPTTTMTVLDTRIDKQSSRRGASYNPVVRYAYDAGGTRHESEVFAAYPISGSNSYAKRFLEDYPVGSQHTVYYSNDGRSVLAVGTNWKNHARLGGGILALAIAAWVFFRKPDEEGDDTAEAV